MMGIEGEWETRKVFWKNSCQDLFAIDLNIRATKVFPAILDSWRSREHKLKSGSICNGRFGLRPWQLPYPLISPHSQLFFVSLACSLALFSNIKTLLTYLSASLPSSNWSQSVSLVHQLSKPSNKSYMEPNHLHPNDREVTANSRTGHGYL